MAISVGIGIEGEKQFKAAISDINKNLAVLSSEMTKVTAAYDANDQSVDALRSKQSVYNKQIAEQKNKIDTLKQALVNSAKEYGENSTQAKNWQIALNKAEAELSKTERALKGTTDQLDRAGEGLDNAEKQTEEFTAGTKQSVSITGILGETFNNLGNKIGVPMDKFKMFPKSTAIAVGAIAAVAVAVGALTKKLLEAGKQAGEFADNILTMSVQTHVSADSLQQYAYYAELVDVSMDTVGRSLGKLTKSMSTAQSGTGAQAEAFRKLGISITDANGNLRNSNDVFAETIEALGKVGNETEADAMAAEIFGRSFQDLNPLVAIGADAMKEFAEEAKRMGSNLSGEALAALGEVDDAYQRLNATQTNLTNAIGALVAPMQAQMVAGIAGMIGSMAAGLNEGQLMAGEFAQTVATGISNAAQKITENIPQFLDIGLKIVGNIIQGIGAAMPTVMPLVVQGLLDMINVMVTNIPLFANAAVQIITGLAMGLVNAIPLIVAMIPTLITSLIDAILGSIPMLIQAGIDLLVALVAALPDIILAIVEAIPQIIDGIITALIDSLPLIIDAGVKLFISLIENLPTIIVEIVKALPQIIVAIVKGIVGAIPQLISAGADLIKGLWQGIVGMGTWLWDKIKGFFKGITDKIKDFFGIKSPSRVFAGLGKMIPAGFAEGVKDAMPQAISDIEAQFAGITASVSPDVRMSGGAAAGGNVVNIYPQSMTEAQFDYIYAKMNARLAT